MQEDTQSEAVSFALGRVAVISDRGLNPRRELNEDSYLILQHQGLFAVADGVGGQNAGEIASRTALEIVRQHLPQRAKGDRTRALEQLVRYGNRALYEASLTDEQCAGMATTLALLWLDRRNATICHVGDSRVYRLSAGQLYRETVDHSLAEDQRLAEGVETESIGRNVITRALGVDPDVQPDFKRIPLESATTFLLCTDGVTRHVTDEEIWQLLLQEPDPACACQELKERCYERGARDNLTALIVRIDSTTSALSQSSRARGVREAVSNRPAADRPIVVPLEGSMPVETDEVSPREGPAGIPTSWAAHFEDEPLPAKEKKLASRGWAILFAVGLIVLSLWVGMYLEHKWHVVRPTGDVPTAIDRAQALFDSGVRKYEAGKFMEAEGDFMQASALAPSRGAYFHWLGKVQIMLTRYADAGRSFEQAAGLDAGTENYLLAAAAYESHGDTLKARAAVEQYQRRTASGIR